MDLPEGGGLPGKQTGENPFYRLIQKRRKGKTGCSTKMKLEVHSLERGEGKGGNKKGPRGKKSLFRRLKGKPGSRSSEREKERVKIGRGRARRRSDGHGERKEGIRFFRQKMDVES